MSTSQRMTGQRALTAALGIVLVLLGPIVRPAAASSAPATAGTTQAQIDALLRSTSGGVQISYNEVAWHGAAVVMAFPGQGVLAQRCPAGWSCFFENRDWGGRMLKFQSCGMWQHFVNYGFRNQTSSWHNATNRLVEVNDDDATSPIRLWDESPDSRSSWVGSGANDRADAFQILC